MTQQNNGGGNVPPLGVARSLAQPINKRDVTLKGIGDRGGKYVSYIITQSGGVFIKDIADIDVMVDPDTDESCCFATYEEAATHLMYLGVRLVHGGFPFNINIVRLQ